MNIPEEQFSTLAQRAAQIEILAGLEHAFDASFRQLRRAALAKWHAAHAGVKDPADACVRVRVSVRHPGRGVRGSGFLKTQSRKKSEAKQKVQCPRFAR